PTQQKQLLESTFKQLLNGGLTLGVMPVADRGELFFQDGQRVYAVSLESGVPLPGWQQTYGSERNGTFVLSGAASAPRDHQLTLTLTDRYVVGVMGEGDPQAAQFGIQTQDKLVCLDRPTGKELWTVTASQLPQESLKN